MLVHFFCYYTWTRLLNREATNLASQNRMSKRHRFLKDLYYGRDAHTNTKKWMFGTEEVDILHRRSGRSAQKQWTFGTEAVDIRHRSSVSSAPKFHSLISHEKMLSY